MESQSHSRRKRSSSLIDDYHGSTCVSTSGTQSRSSKRLSIRSVAANSKRSRFTRKKKSKKLVEGIHVVAAVSENLARETCVATMDAGAPVVLNVCKQCNAQTYAETIVCLQLLKPREIILNEGRRNSPLARKILDCFGDEQHNQDNDCIDTIVKFVSRVFFDQTKGAGLLQKVIKERVSVASDYILLSSSHAVLHYVSTSLGATFTKASIDFQIDSSTNRMMIDRSTMLQLELLVNAKTGKAKNTLIDVMDKTKTSVGGRLLRTNLLGPPSSLETIEARLELVEFFLRSEELLEEVGVHLSHLPDMEKMLSHVSLIPKPRQDVDAATASKGISALVCIKTVLQSLPGLARLLENSLDGENDAQTVNSNRQSLAVGMGRQSLDGDVQCVRQDQVLARAIVVSLSQPALQNIQDAIAATFSETTTYSRDTHTMRHQECFALKAEENGMMAVVREAFLRNVDEIYKLADNYAEQFGISVHVKYTNSRGYFLSVPADAGSNLPGIFVQPSATHKHITCTTEEVSNLNTRITDNIHDLLLMTHDRIQQVLDLARTEYDAMATLSKRYLIHSDTASPLKWCRPLVTTKDSENNVELVIKNGRYPIDVPERADLANCGGPTDLIPNDTYATESNFFTVVTGINGSGKSTYLKQIAIITILAHCGSYVPAQQATIPLRDRVCCRIGTTDDQEHNISTFLLEMKETAYICNNCTKDSLVLIDELGRATSNEDGVAIAWATAEYLLKQRSLSFFVTQLNAILFLPEDSSISTLLFDENWRLSVEPARRRSAPGVGTAQFDANLSS